MNQERLELPDDVLGIVDERVNRVDPLAAQNSAQGSLISSSNTKPTLRGGYMNSSREVLENDRKPSKSKTLASEPKSNETCRHCSSIELDEILKNHFGINACTNCRQAYDDQYYKLITKTTAREEFLLTDEELGDKLALPYMTKPNPHKSTWSDMHLYLLGDVRKFSIKKWGSLNAIDEELARRVKAKDMRKEKKFREKLSDLRRKTRVAAIRKNISTPITRHQHIFEKDSSSIKKCRICSMEVEQEEI